MADINVEREPARNYSTILAVVSVVLIAGFLWWLGVSSEPTQVAVIEDEVADTAGVGEEARMDVTLAQIAAGPEAYVGRELAVRDVAVSSRMGAQAFWTELPNNQPFLIKLDSTLIASQETVSSGERMLVRGMMHAMTDSVLTAWEASGAIRDEMERAEAEFAQQFLEASRLRRAAADDDDN